MKPIRLIVQAFGPYADTQEFDFRKLSGHEFFLIHGDTGAGAQLDFAFFNAAQRPLAVDNENQFRLFQADLKNRVGPFGFRSAGDEARGDCDLVRPEDVQQRQQVELN